MKENKGYIPKDQRKKILFLADDMRVTSGVGTMAREIIEGIQTVKSVQIVNKVGSNLGYSDYAYDITGATANNVVYPSLDPMIFEVKYPNTDIQGKVVPF